MRSNLTIIKFMVALILSVGYAEQTHAQYAYGDHWYSNPLGFSPINMHTSMGAILPTTALLAVLVFTKQNAAYLGHLKLFSECFAAWGYKDPYTSLHHLDVGMEYTLRKYMSVGIEVNSYFPKDPFNDVAGFGIRPFVRFYFVTTSKFKLYFESGGGLVMFTKEFPQPTTTDSRKGTFLNGSTKYGIGVEYALNTSYSVSAGVKHIHISNGNTSGRDRNPSHDSNGIFVGFAKNL